MKRKVFAALILLLFVAAFTLDYTGVTTVSHDQEIIMAGGPATIAIVAGVVFLVSAGCVVIRKICSKDDPNARSLIRKAMEDHREGR